MQKILFMELMKILDLYSKINKSELLLFVIFWREIFVLDFIWGK